MTQVHSVSLRLTPEHKFLASRNEETVWETKCSNLFPMETDSCLLLLFLICVFLVFLMECCNRSSLKPERPMCDGCPFASPLFRRLAGRGPFFRGFPFRWALQLTVSLARCLTYTMSCLFFAALWLHRSQSVLLQGIQPAKDINLIDSADQVRHMLASGPTSLEWPTALLAGSDQSSPSFSHEDLLNEQPGDALPAPPHLRWRSDALQPPQVQQGGVDWNSCVHIPYGGLGCVTWNTRGLIGSVSSSQNLQGAKT